MLVKLDIAPGIFTETTAVGAENRWKDGNLIRFRYGLPEKVGGWLKQKPSTAFLGTCRALHDWTALDGTRIIAVGTDKKLYVWVSEVLYDITPLRASGNLANPFSTTITSNIVNVHHVAHGAQVGDYVRFSGASAVGGITINGEYTVTALVDADNYTITHTIAATSTAGPGGGAAVAYQYDISIGSTSSSIVSGWGSGTWGSGGWGVGSASSTAISRLRIWSLVNWGEDLLASPRDGAVYWWDKSAGTSTRAALVSAAPPTNCRIILSQEDRHLISLGSDDSGTDRLLIRWCDQEDFNTWTATDSNTAGDLRVESGSEIITGVRTRGETLVFTDVGIHAMYFLGSPFVFGIRQIAETVTIASPNAAVEMNGTVFFMGTRNFYIYDGMLRPLPCDLWTDVFDDINTDQHDKVYASTNREFNEVWFFYPSNGSTEVDRYVAYNYVEGHWTKGTLARTAYHDHSSLFQAPYATGTDGFIYKHETGVNNDTVAMTGVFLESHDIQMSNGNDFPFIDKLIPDFQRLAGTLSVYVKTKQYPATASYTTKGPYSVDSTTKKFNLRARGRQAALRIESGAINDDFRMGAWRANTVPHGKR